MKENNLLIQHKHLRVTMPDGSLYDVPIIAIALHRAKEYADEFSSVEVSLHEDTLPLFENNPYQIQDWAAGNMNWSDVAEQAKRITRPKSRLDFQEGWVNGEKKVV